MSTVSAATTNENLNQNEAQEVDPIVEETGAVERLMGAALFGGFVFAAANNPRNKQRYYRNELYKNILKQTREDQLVSGFFTAPEKPKTKDKISLSEYELVNNAVKNRQTALSELGRLVKEQYGDTIIDPSIHSSVNDFVTSLFQNPVYKKVLAPLGIDGLLITTADGKKVNVLAPLIANNVLKIPQKQRAEIATNLTKISSTELAKSHKEEMQENYSNLIRGYKKGHIARSENKKAVEHAWESRQLVEKLFFGLVSRGQVHNLEYDLHQAYIAELRKMPWLARNIYKYVDDKPTRELMSMYARNWVRFGQSLKRAEEEHVAHVNSIIAHVNLLQQEAAKENSQQPSSGNGGFNVSGMFDNAKTLWDNVGSKATSWVGENVLPAVEGGFNNMLSWGSGLFGGGGGALGTAAGGALGTAGAGAVGLGATGAAAGAGAAVGGAGLGAAAIATSEIWIPLLIIGVVVFIIIVALFLLAMNMSSSTTQPYALQGDTQKVEQTIQTAGPPASYVTLNSSLDGVLKTSAEKARIPEALLHAIARRETNTMNNLPAEKFKFYNTYGWWELAASKEELCAGFAYNTCTSEIPAEVNGKFSGLYCAAPINQCANGIVVMGPMQFTISTWSGYENKVKEVSGKTEVSQLVLEDAFLGAALKIYDNSGIEKEASTTWKTHNIINAARSYYGSCEWELDDGKHGNYCTEVCEYYNEYSAEGERVSCSETGSQ